MLKVKLLKIYFDFVRYKGDIKWKIFGNVLDSVNKQKLISWLKNNTTGNNRIRAGIPKSWVAGDKTGTGGYGTTNDVGIIWVKGCSPVVMTIYCTQYSKMAYPNENAVAEATKIISANLTSQYISSRCYQ